MFLSIKESSHSDFFFLFLGLLDNLGLLVFLLVGLLLGHGGGDSGGGGGGGAAEVEEIGEVSAAHCLCEDLWPIRFDLHSCGLQQGSQLLGGDVLTVIVEDEGGIGECELRHFLSRQFADLDAGHYHWWFSIL